MKLIVGLGNPGEMYENTRHNIGFILLDNYCKTLNIIFKEKFNGLFAKINLKGEDIIFLKPLTYMNLSGECVSKFAHYYKVEPHDILIIHDDLDMNFGRIKLKENGSSGGHNGIKNIIECLRSEEFKRLKFGISNNKLIDTKDYVLGKFNEEEIEEIKNLSIKVNNILNDYVNFSFQDLMSKYNRR